VSTERFRALSFTPPPEPGSKAQDADLAAILAWQTKRTLTDCAKATKTSALSCDSFWSAKSPFPLPLPIDVKTFFNQLASDLDKAANAMKARWERPRPYQAYPGQVLPCVEKSSGYSYPSGHAVFSRVFAHVLTDIAPERKDEYFAKAEQISLDRVIGGVHYPTDIAAGKLFGDLYYAELLKSGAYRADVEKMKSLLAK